MRCQKDIYNLDSIGCCCPCCFQIPILDIFRNASDTQHLALCLDGSSPAAAIATCRLSPDVLTKVGGTRRHSGKQSRAPWFSSWLSCSWPPPRVRRSLNIRCANRENGPQLSCLSMTTRLSTPWLSRHQTNGGAMAMLPQNPCRRRLPQSRANHNLLS
jgi:hypothetical protein